MSIVACAACSGAMLARALFQACRGWRENEHTRHLEFDSERVFVVSAKEGGVVSRERRGSLEGNRYRGLGWRMLMLLLSSCSSDVHVP
jgi:hypothetical protein